jgi:hypothetical protein
VQPLDDIGREDAEWGSRDWCAYVRLYICTTFDHARSTVNRVQGNLKIMRDEEHYFRLQDRDGRDFATWEDFCQYPRPWGLGISADVANAIIDEPDGSRRVAHVAAEVMARAKPLAAHGEVGKGRGRVDNVNSKTDGGNSADYLAARIKRDRPDIAERVEAGEFRSIRSAAIEAGIVKKRGPVEAAMSAWRKMSMEDQEQFLDWASRNMKTVADATRAAA